MAEEHMAMQTLNLLILKGKCKKDRAKMNSNNKNQKISKNS